MPQKIHNLGFSSTLGKTSFVNLDIHNRFCQLIFFCNKNFFPPNYMRVTIWHDQTKKKPTIILDGILFWHTKLFTIVADTMEDGSRFGHFWWFYARVYYVYILVDQP